MENLAQISLYNQQMDKSYGFVTINISWFKLTGSEFELKIEDMDADDFHVVVSQLIESHIDYRVFGEGLNLYVSGKIEQIIEFHWNW